MWVQTKPKTTQDSRLDITKQEDISGLERHKRRGSQRELAEITLTVLKFFWFSRTLCISGVSMIGTKWDMFLSASSLYFFCRHWSDSYMNMPVCATAVTQNDFQFQLLHKGIFMIIKMMIIKNICCKAYIVDSVSIWLTLLTIFLICWAWMMSGVSITVV